MRKTVFLSITFLLMFALSCNKENDFNSTNKTVQIEEGVELKNGVLHFATQEDFDKLNAKLNQMSEKRYRNQCESNNFESFYVKITSIYEALAQCETEDEVYKMLDENKAYVKLIDDGYGEKMVENVYENNEYNKLKSIKGVYAINNKAYKNIETNQLSCNINDLKLLENMDAIGQVNDNIKLEKVFHSNNKYCPGYERKSATKDERWCRKDRKVFLQYWFLHRTGNSTWNKYIVKIRVTGQRKITSCVWVNYLTNLSYDLDATIRINHNGVINYVHLDTGLRSGSNLYQYVGEFEVKGYLVGDNCDAYATYVYAKATSTGVGSKWAIFSCQ